MNRVFGKYCGHMTGKTLFASGKYALIKFPQTGEFKTQDF